uniref:Uncharacterized protein n=1 Tax=Salix viminalis TaxID=40686 RepID=A0A6N2N5K5_SALVM
MLPPQHCSDHSRHCHLRRLPGNSPESSGDQRRRCSSLSFQLRRSRGPRDADKHRGRSHDYGFSNFNLELFFDGIRIAVLSTAAPYEVKKNSSVDFNYDYTSDPIPLSPEQMEDVDAFLKEDEVRFDLKGGVRARWRVGVLGSVGFFCSLNCQLRFHPANGTYISRRCSSRAK